MIQTAFFQILSKFSIYSWDIYSSKNNPGVIRSSYGVNKKNFPDICVCYFLNWKHFSDIWKNYPSLSKSTSKYLIYYQVFWVQVRCLQDQCTSVSTLVFHYFVSNILQHYKNFTRNVLNSINYILPKYVFEQKYILFHIRKITVKSFIVVVTLLNFPYTFCFSFPPTFSMPFLYLLICEEFLIFFRWLAFCWWFFFHF